MSKYDFEMELSEHTSTGKLVKMIKPGSTVLEFGCAEGRMTEYMKEKLGCSVYICEYNKEAYEHAINFAADGVCGDLCDYEWEDRFKEIGFDVIMFADVLEHIPEPVEVLKRVSKLLKREGSILVSVPNVTHNDVILKAMEERFDYTSVGILDNTHIKFWGKENIPGTVEEAGLYLKDFDATYCETGYTEQYGGNVPKMPMYLRNLLKERECGEVYQFVMALGINDGSRKSAELKKRDKGQISTVFFDRGSGYSIEDSDCFISHRDNEGKYIAEFCYEVAGDVKNIRFDPVEKQPCIIKKLVVKLDEKELVPQYGEHLSRKDGILLFGDDPQVNFVVPDKKGIKGFVKEHFSGRSGDKLTVYAEFLIAGDEFYGYLMIAVKEQAKGGIN